MLTITTHQAKTHLSRYLAAVEKGEEFIITRRKKQVARLLPISPHAPKMRPKVGEIQGEPFDFPDSAFAALKEQELNDWGL